MATMNETTVKYVAIACYIALLILALVTAVMFVLGRL